MRRPAGAVASSYGWPDLLQEVDLVEALQQRGLSQEAACAFLDSGPTVVFQVGCQGMQRAVCQAPLHWAGMPSRHSDAWLSPMPLQVHTAGRFDCVGLWDAGLVLMDRRPPPPPLAPFECERCCPACMALPTFC